MARGDSRRSASNGLAAESKQERRSRSQDSHEEMKQLKFSKKEALLNGHWWNAEVENNKWTRRLLALLITLEIEMINGCGLRIPVGDFEPSIIGMSDVDRALSKS